MSVRRLAEADVQPESFAFSRANGAWAKKKLKDYPKGREASAVIPLLMRAQEQEGWVTKAAIEHVAEMLSMPLIRVLEVATFYTQFQLAPVGKRAHVQVCGTTPCMLRGSGELMDVCRKRIAPRPFELSDDGNLSWEEVECQGACVNAPMVMIFKDSYEDLTPERMEEIIDAFDAGRGDEIAPGTQIDRIFSAPEGGLTSLTSDPTITGARTGDGDPDGEPMPATDAARPPSHVEHASGGAIKTAMSRDRAEAAKDRKTEKRVEAGDPSPKRRAKRLADEARAETDGPISPADMRDPKPKELDAKSRRVGTRSAGLLNTGSAAEGATEHARKAHAVTTAKPSRTRAKPPKANVTRAASQGADDLKMIAGIGPKIERQLHDHGIRTFAQIAAWKKADRERIGAELRFSGRIEREDWVRQAKALAKGGRDEYVRVFGKEPR